MRRVLPWEGGGRAVSPSLALSRRRTGMAGGGMAARASAARLGEAAQARLRSAVARLGVAARAWRRAVARRRGGSGSSARLRAVCRAPERRLRAGRRRLSPGDGWPGGGSGVATLGVVRVQEGIVLRRWLRLGRGREEDAGAAAPELRLRLGRGRHGGCRAVRWCGGCEMRRRWSGRSSTGGLRGLRLIVGQKLCLGCRLGPTTVVPSGVASFFKASSRW